MSRPCWDGAVARTRRSTPRRAFEPKGVPAPVCSQCGEAYFDEATTQHIEAIVKRAQHTGVQVAVQDYAAA